MSALRERIYLETTEKDPDMDERRQANEPEGYEVIR